MIKSIIIDDEVAALETLQSKLNKCTQEIEVISLCNSAKEGLNAIHKLKPDLVFLDIEMPWMNGFELLECLGEQINFDVVFVTAYDQYAIRAFKAKAVDYLLKPVDRDDLKDCIDRIRRNQNQFSYEKLENLIEEMDKPIRTKRILLHTNQGIEILRQDEVNYCQAESNYCVIHSCSGQKIIVSKSLNQIEKLLDPNAFFRVHRSFTVNINQIKKFLNQDGGEVMLESGTKIPVSRRRKEELLDILSKNII